jgi:hypothetical protein
VNYSDVTFCSGDCEKGNACVYTVSIATLLIKTGPVLICENIMKPRS